MSSGPSALVIGLGNSFAGDDAAGVLVARLVARRAPAVAVREHEGEPSGLLDAWDGAPLAIVVDATVGQGEPGEVTVLDATARSLPPGYGGTSTHAFGLAAAIELARALGRMPERLLVVGVEGRDFSAGDELGASVAAALEPAAEVVLSLLREGRTGRNSEHGGI